MREKRISITISGDVLKQLEKEKKRTGLSYNDLVNLQLKNMKVVKNETN